MKKLSFVLLAACYLTACHTIYVKNGPESEVLPTITEWHHIGVFDLVEYSKPVDLNNRCGESGWSGVQTRENFLQVLIDILPYVSAAWSPWEVQITCNANHSAVSSK